MKEQLTKILLLLAVVAFLLSTSGVYSLIDLETSTSKTNATAKVDFAEGTNHYKLIEVDNGDNNEEQVVSYILHEFVFSIQGDAESAEWNFGDDSQGSGLITSHQYEEPGFYDVTVTILSGDTLTINNLEITVNLKGVVEADNMECTCAPTAKDTIIDLKSTPLPVIMDGSVTVKHDGSSEPCSSRFPFQDCHLRVKLQWTQDGQVIFEETLFDDTFRTDEMSINFTLDWINYEDDDGIQILLETDQLRDWHKPSAEWYSTVV